MATCVNCHQPVAEAVDPCPACGASQARLRQLLGGPVPGAPRAPGAAGAAAARRSAHWATAAKVAALAAVAVGAVAYCAQPRRMPRIEVPAAQANTAAGDPCAGKRRCVVVYVAPWCHVCRDEVPTIKEMVARFQPTAEVGVKVVIGMDRPERLEAMAAQIGDGTFLDPDRRFAAGYDIEAVPHWFLLDAQRRLRRELAGGTDFDGMVDALGL